MSELNNEQVEDLRAAVEVLVRVFKVGEATGDGCMTPKLNPPDVQSLLYVHAHPQCIASEVATFLNVVPTTMSAIVDRLVRRDLICRQRVEENRRIVQLAVTQAGRMEAERLIAQQFEHCKVMLAALLPEERAPFVQAMGKIATTIS